MTQLLRTIAYASYKTRLRHDLSEATLALDEVIGIVVEDVKFYHDASLQVRLFRQYVRMRGQATNNEGNISMII